ncbi:FAD-dependent oxidoreductase [Salicibibacter cibarius]|uniref:FAD-dependent oxidoreductase n=1 Tax=Salicibibacter cibarius TaxID=2743000 RepID=A0A7T6Z675_9BACI|nr:FAD-dependent oxidoreductase [Salicibibacter cibarius]QQK77743.1 FAD-dependent oxidoreductase [Salicibibacter cibarius]
MSINQNIDTRNDFKTLFSAHRIGKREVKNRIVSTAHAPGFDSGLLIERHVSYLEQKAAGGAGLIMAFGSASVYRESSASYGSVSLWNPENEPLLKDLAERVHKHDALIISQATHMGRRGNSSISGRPLQAPSEIPEGVHREIPHVLRTDEIPSIVEAFAEAAARLERCGWDGIEITSFGGHLIEQFWSPYINNRTDRYGGDLTGRMRFSVEVIEAVAEAVSDDFIIGFRMAGDLITDDLGLDQNDMIEIAMRLDELDHIDLFNISGGNAASYAGQAGVVPGDTFSRGTYNHAAHRMKENLSVPVLVAGRIFDPYQAERALVAGDCDLVGMTRAIIADPDLPKKAMEGEISRIRPCNACTEGCIGRLYSGMPMICTVNPAIEDETLENYQSATSIRRMIIVGGGPAGMEAARVAAERGLEVILMERENYLGGQVVSASAAPERPHYGEHIKWLEKELTRLSIDVRCGTEVSPETLLSLNPDVVVIATGSNPSISSITKKMRTRCVTDIDVLDGKVSIEPGIKVLIYDQEGKFRGASISNFIANAGASQVELATPLWSVAEDLDEMQKPEIYRLLTQNNITLLPNHSLIGQKDEGIQLSNVWSDHKKIIKDADLVVLVGYQSAENRLYDQIAQVIPDLELHLIGDAIAPRRLSDAIFEGANVGRIL